MLPTTDKPVRPRERCTSARAMLGHAKLDTTQIYTQVSIQKLKDIHTATHPVKNKQAKNELSNQSPSESKTKH